MKRRNLSSLSAGTGLGAVCGNAEDKSKERFIKIAKKRRYALLTSETSGPETSALLELFNSYENRHGEYIKVVIGSPVTRDGLNLANVLQVHLVEPWWNEASIYQAESRAIRSTSHVDLLEDKRKELERAGLPTDNVTIEIKVYRHAAVNKEGKSIDVQMYELSEEKDRQIKRVMRMMKQCAVDCQINYMRNVRPKDIDYSKTCDYDICAYKCVDPAPSEIDFTSYDVLYSDEIVEAAKQEIEDIFRVVFSITYDELYEELKDYRRKFIDLAVTDLVEKRIPIYNRYGIRSYLREDGNNLFLRNDYPLNTFEAPGAVALTEYSSYLLGIKEMSLNEYNTELQLGEGNILESISRARNIDEKIDSLTIENKVLLLETSIRYYYIDISRTQGSEISTALPKDKTDKTEEYRALAEKVISKYRNYVFIEFEPVKTIEMARKFVTERGKGRGRKPKEGAKFKLKEREAEELIKSLEKPSSKTIVYFHDLYAAARAATAFALTAEKRATIRILRDDEPWRDVTDIEDIVYSEIIKLKRQREKVEYDIYGLIIEDGELRIVDRTTEKNESRDKRVRSVEEFVAHGIRKI